MDATRKPGSAPALATLLTGAAAEQGETAAADPKSGGMHRYLIERTFPAGALDGIEPN